MTAASELADRLAADAANLELEVRELDLLVSQATTETTRHETRRAAAADKLGKLGETAPPREVIELAGQVVNLTRRAALMQAQLEILEAKRKALTRLQDAINADAARVRELDAPAAGSGGADGSGGPDGTGDDETVLPPAVSRLVLTAQEDLRREIARAMHDGPAQSLTNIVLQAEIVERLVAKDPALATGEVRQLVAMVQQTLEATKTFIFDVRPMVLDDLGLVPTLRRAARDRGRRAGIAVAFESVGVDRRLPVEVESGLFRIADEALASYLAARPEQVSLGLDWSDALVVTLRASRNPKPVPPLDLPDPGEKIPPALAAIFEERRHKHDELVEAARRAAVVKLPARLQRDLLRRATTLGIGAESLDDGGGLHLTVALPGGAPDADAPEPDPAAGG